ncbi:heterocyst development glycosyltransferase HepC [Euhalothece natronophila]|nr:heterocyst development glycosyltransferase HepC [Euhalothece natronophila]
MVVTVPTNPSEATFDQKNGELAWGCCYLRWRGKQLWVKSAREENLMLPALSNETWLRNCLQCSAVKKIYLDANLGKRAILIWAAIARSTKKEVWIRIPSTKQKNQPHFGVNRAFNWLLAVNLFFLMAPCLLLLIILLKVFTGNFGLTQQWCVNERGLLFQKATLSTGRKGLDFWLEKTGLANLPQFWNVIKGDMKLMGSCPNSLEEALT